MNRLISPGRARPRLSVATCSAGSAAEMEWLPESKARQPGQPRRVSVAKLNLRCVPPSPPLQSGPSLSTAAPPQHAVCLGLGPALTACAAGSLTGDGNSDPSKSHQQIGN